MRTLRRRLRRIAGLRRADVSALTWSHRALSRARRDLPTQGTRARVSPPPPGLPASALPLVLALLRVRKATCLERSLVVQRWLASQGLLVPVAIGVRTDNAQFAAHAWLPGFDTDSAGSGYTEIRRVAPA